MTYQFYSAKLKNTIGIMRFVRLAIMLGILIVWTGYVSAGSNAISDRLQTRLDVLDPDSEVAVIISFSERVDSSKFRTPNRKTRRAMFTRALRQRADKSQRPIKKLLRTESAKNVRSLWLINGLAGQLPKRFIERIALRPNVESIELDYQVVLPVASYDSAAAVEWNISAIGADLLWGFGADGQGVVIASMDTGVDVDHPDLSGRWRGGEGGWFDPHGEHEFPYDADGHGTQTMGIMLGGNAGGTAIGVAPGAQWIAVKIFNDAGLSNLSDIHAGFQWLLDPDGDPNTDDAPDVVNNSWGLGGTTGMCQTEFLVDIETLKAAGIAVVFSGGNEGPSPSSDRSPANYIQSFAAGAVGQDGIAGLFSSRGPRSCGGGVFPDVVAPGISIRTTDLSLGSGGTYITVSGTSFSASHLSGAMALLFSAFADASVSEVEDALQTTAFDLGEIGPDNTYGYGFINLAAAYEFMAVARGGLADCVIDDDGIDSDLDGFSDNDNVCMSMVQADGFVDMANGRQLYVQNLARVSGMVPLCSGQINFELPATPIVLRQGQKLYLTIGNCGFDDLLSFDWHGFDNSASIFGGFSEASVGIGNGQQFTYFYDIAQPGTYLWHGNSQMINDIQLGMYGQIHVEPAQNLTLADEQVLAHHVHLAGDKYAYNDGDGSTYYDVEYSLQLSAADGKFHDAYFNGEPVSFKLLKDEYPLINFRGYPETNVEEMTVSRGQTLLLRLSNVSVVNYYTVRLLSLPMRVIAKGARLLRGPDGKSLDYQTSSVTLGGGQTVDVIVETANAKAGTYFLYTTNLNYLSNNQQDYGGMMIEVKIVD